MAKTSQKEIVRLLSIEHGFKRAAELSGVPYDLVRQWSVRGNWKASQNVTERPVAVAIANVRRELATHERETRLSLARSARRMSKDAENATLRDSPYVHKAAQVAGLVHGWAEDKGSTTFTLNTLNINSLSVDSTSGPEA